MYKLTYSPLPIIYYELCIYVAEKRKKEVLNKHKLLMLIKRVQVSSKTMQDLVVGASWTHNSLV